MREFFMTSCPIGIWAITVLEFVLICLFFKRYKTDKRPIVLCMTFITIGLFIDALFISLGTLLPIGLLTTISPIRYIAHGVLIPLLFPIAAYGLKAKDGFRKVVWVIAIILMVAGAAEAIATKLEPAEFAGVIRLVQGEGTPGWAVGISMALSFGTVIPLMIAGIIIWAKQKKPQLFLSGFFMFAFSALGPATGNSDLIFYISMFGELLMVTFFYLFAKATEEK